MPAIDAPFHGLSTNFYVNPTSAVSLAAPGTAVSEVGNIGTLELGANIIEFNAYGEGYKRKLVGQKDSGTLEITLNWVPDASTATEQADLKGLYDSGDKGYFAIIWSDPAGDQAGCTFSGFVASFTIDQPVEDVVTANVTIAIDGAVTFDTDGTFI
jgi:hypothetical protein